MKRGTATRPGTPTIEVDLTPFEQAEKDQKDADFRAGQPERDWLYEIAASDNKMPRGLEDVIEALDTPTRNRINSETIGRYNAKKEIRGRKP